MEWYNAASDLIDRHLPARAKRAAFIDERCTLTYGELASRVDKAAGALRGLPVFTYRPPFDLMVVPSRSSRIASAHERVLWCPFHSMLPGHRPLMDHIAGELARLEAGVRPG